MKEKFENHPVIFGITMIIIGFIAGYKVHPELNPPKLSDPIVKVKTVREVLGCKVIGLEKLSHSHNGRLSALQEQLMSVEAEASDINNYAYRHQLEATATRIRADIEFEFESYEKTLTTLNKRCDKKA